MFKPQDLVSNRYLIEKTLGSGGMGTVFLARDQLQSDREVALKTILPDKFSIEQVHILKREFMTLTGLSHPNLVKVYDFVIDEDVPTFYFTSEYVVGEDLFSATEGLAEKEITPLVVKVVRALEYIHSRGVIHYDLKPTNVIVKPDGDVKLLDFGLAQELGHMERRLTGGTLAYMAPEVCKRGRVDARADLYSLGVMLFHVFMRKHHADLLKTDDSFFLQSTPIPKPPNMETAPIGEPYKSIIATLVKVNPDERFREANDVIREINRMTARNYMLETPDTREGYIFSGPLVGREKEIRYITEHFQHSILTEFAPFYRKEEYPGAVIIEGGPGLGKDRIIREFKYMVQVEGAVFLSASCHDGDERPLGPFPEIIRQAVAVTGMENRLVSEHMDVLRRFVPELANRWEQIETDFHGLDETETVERASDFLLEFASEYSSVICVGDLHMGSPAVIEMFGRLADRAWEKAVDRKSPGVMLAGTYDPGGAGQPETMKLLGALAEAHWNRKLTLAPFDEKDTEKHISNIFAVEEIEPAFLERVVSITGGNPLLIQLFLQTLTEKEIIRPKRGIWDIDLRRALSEPLPRSFGGIYKDQLTRLKKNDKKLLRLASCFDVSAPREFLFKLMSPSEKQASAALRRLLSRNILVSERRDSKVCLRFTRQTMRKIIYEGLDSTTRRNLHRKIARTGAKFFEAEIAEYNAFLGDHFERGHLPERAAEHWIAEAKRQLETFQNLNEAGRYFQLAIRSIKKYTKTKIEAILGLIMVDLQKDRLDKAEEKLDRISRRRPVPYVQLRSMYFRGEIAHRRGEEEKALEYMGKGLRIARRRKIFHEIVRISEFLGRQNFMNANIMNAEMHFQEMREAADAADEPGALSRAISNLAWLSWLAGDTQKAWIFCQEAEKLSRRRGLKLLQAVANLDIARLCRRINDYEGSLERLEEAAKIGENAGDPGMLFRIYAEKARAFARLFRPHDAIAAVEKALNRGEKPGLEENNVVVTLAMFDAYRLMGRFQAAEKIVSGILGRAKGNGHAILRFQATMRKAELLLDMDRNEEALDLAVKTYEEVSENKISQFVKRSLILACRAAFEIKDLETMQGGLYIIETEVEKDGTPEERAWICLLRALRAWMEETDDAVRHFQDAVKITTGLAPFFRAEVLRGFGTYLAVGKKDPASARPFLLKASELFKNLTRGGFRSNELEKAVNLMYFS